MTEPGRHDRDRYAGIEHLGCHEVTKIVESKVARPAARLILIKRLVTKFGDHGRAPALSELKMKQILEVRHSPIG